MDFQLTDLHPDLHQFLHLIQRSQALFASCIDVNSQKNLHPPLWSNLGGFPVAVETEQ